MTRTIAEVMPGHVKTKRRRCNETSQRMKKTALCSLLVVPARLLAQLLVQ